MPPESDKHALAKAIQQRILTGPAKVPPELRPNAFENRELPEPLDPLLDSVAPAAVARLLRDAVRG